MLFRSGKQYKATILKDGINADKEADDYRITTSTVSNTSKEKIRMASGGGFAVKLEPVK